VAALLKDERFVKDPTNVASSARRARAIWLPSQLRPLARNMLDLDAPDHARLRGLVHQAFTPRLVERLRDRIQARADELLDTARRMAGGGPIDLVGAYALPLPATVIADLLGVPPSDRHRFHRWSSRIVGVSSGAGALWMLPAALAFLRYVRGLVARRRADPGDDLITALLRAEEADDRLSEDDLLAMIFLLLVAGHETTVNLIAGGTLALLDHPDQLERLRADPALLGTAIEELLRYSSPLDLATERYARTEVTIAGTTIPAGALTFAVIGSANRDEEQFAEPDALDLARQPNRHLAFGQGAHYCLGAPLARLEGQIALATLLRRAPDLRLAVPRASLRWRRSLFMRGLRELPVVSA
jgi:cytochrome P450 PksS